MNDEIEKMLNQIEDDLERFADVNNSDVTWLISTIRQQATRIEELDSTIRMWEPARQLQVKIMETQMERIAELEHQIMEIRSGNQKLTSVSSCCGAGIYHYGREGQTKCTKCGHPCEIKEGK